MDKEKVVVNFENLKNIYNLFLYKIKESADLTSQGKCEKHKQNEEVRNDDGSIKWRNNELYDENNNVNEKASENSQKHNDNKIENSLYETEAKKETTCNECIDKHEGNIILFSYIGKKLFLNNNLIVNKNENLKNYIIIKKENSLWMIFGNKKNLYAVIIMSTNKRKGNKKDKQKKNVQKIDIKNKYSYIYSIYTYCKIRYNSDLRYFIQINFLKFTFKFLKICTINFNEHLLLLLLNYTYLQNDDIKNKFKYFNNSNVLYFIVVNIFERKNDQSLIDGVINVLKRGKKKSSIFHIIKNKPYCDNIQFLNSKKLSSHNKLYTTCYFSNNTESNLYEQRKSLYNEEKIKKNDNIPLIRKSNEFFQNILSIFSLLNKENKPLLNFYNLENHTRIFIYNCEKLNRNIFIHFLKSFQNFYIYFINLNTLFGLYFSETERNIVNIFEKCHKVLRRVSKNVCLVIDGIDIMAKNDTKNIKGNINSPIINEVTKKYDDVNKNRNNRLLATLLLCLDSVDNDTSNKYKATNYNNKNNFETSSDDIKVKSKKKQKDCIENKKNNISMDNDHDDPNFSFSEFSDNNDCSDNTEREREKKKKGKKKKKLSEHIYFDIKKLEKIYKEKYEELIKKKKNNNLSVIVISDMDLTNFDTSLTRAGRFFHYINYRSFC
ncbi:conserved Plasmodium protein, unknown function [Plasmodium berghei]|uniref:Uncharacterized protein n=2 Tax=Plasmodium berghei TaxID=5821 RepID=A0A509AFK0_PLABA|nr:conserved Plasmodium protein, unknown function [Plasmodium berghei ANKA]CXI02666.1 conserved Plasmodium protein, unknown function [Plasmodium berghei]SCL91990.1 conserved Plasmodium protein, unknown function [Plasmodium berghei]SCM15571.1 conserved Plasmodium protein, unknown function [Plasmodium berghei]SCM17363.1 conserved Plasmodium protein, unknown function [Plasmodium berghei]SCN22605.1 conserved Plasmodium protein, unknown function [Plasmodium berghei]|eukprot:XP_034420169.1 conserved Plasmodium protein, unknown function [Plasmodium berghei ANKA]